MPGRGSSWCARLLAAPIIVAVVAALGASVSPAAADQLRGAVLNDVFQLHAAGTATFEAASVLPAPYQDNTLVIFTGQDALDAPEATTDFTAELTALKAAGAQIVRFTIPWPSLETTILPPGSPPTWNPLSVARLNLFFNEAHALGLKVIVNWDATPCGRSSSSDKNCDQLGPWATYPPANENDLTQAIEQLITDWGPDIYAIEVWNEPNIQGFFLSDQGQCDQSDPSALIGPSPDATRAAAYVPMVKAVWNAKTALHSNILVVAGVMSLADTTFLQDLYTDGIKGNYDAISAHPYQLQFAWSSTPTSCTNRPQLIVTTADPANAMSSSLYSFTSGVQALHSVMQQNADNSPLLLTEFGFDSCSGAPGPAVQNGPNPQVLTGQASSGINWSATCVGLGNQASWLAESFKIAAHQLSYVGALTMYQAHDGVDGENQFSLDNWGLMRDDLSPKLSYAEVESTWACLANGTC